MANPVQPIPEGYTTVTPYLIVRDAAKAIEFYKKALGATEITSVPDANGKIGHAELQIGNARIMLADEAPERGYKSPQTFGGSPVSIVLYVESCDAAYAQAIAAGGKSLRPPTDQFYGDRSSGVEDPFGFQWHISTHVEDVSMDELERRMQKQSAA